MNVHLMYKDRDFNPDSDMPANAEDILKDLEVETLLEAVSGGDLLLHKITESALMSGVNDYETIIFRQEILKDCLKNSDAVKDIFDTACGAVEDEKKVYLGLLSRYPDIVLSRSIRVMELFFSRLKELKEKEEKYSSDFTSEGFSEFFSMLNKEITPEYFSEVKRHLKTLKFKKGVYISVTLDSENRGKDYTLLARKAKRTSPVSILLKGNDTVYSYTVSERDESGMRYLSDLRDKGIASCAETLALSAEHILKFFISLRDELAFYIGCINLYNLLEKSNSPVTFPVPVRREKEITSFSNLYDIPLTIKLGRKITGHSISTSRKHLVIITGANRGGKTTFLRSIGISQLMMQCGMFVPAESFSGPVYNGIYTHFKKEEDTDMNSGKLDEELKRMDRIINNITSRSLLLMNESFSATNEKEGSEIARQITLALLEKKVKTYYVTHLYNFAISMYSSKIKGVAFLRAERRKKEEDQFIITEGKPLTTGYAEDTYASIFGSRQ